MERIDELMQRRAALVTELRKSLDKAEAEDRALTSEETQSYERVEAELSEIETRIERLKDYRERQQSLAEAEIRGTFNPRENAGEPNASEEERAYKEAFDKYLRHGMSELDAEARSILRNGYSADAFGESRVLVKGTPATGGYTVPTSFRAQLVTKLELASAIRPFATVLTTNSGETIQIPRVAAHGAASWVGENTAKPFVDETFEQVTLGAYKAVKAIKVSWELLEDSGIDLEGYIANELGRRIGRLEGDAYATGAANSTTTPKGLVNRASVGVTAASSTAITVDELLSLVYSVERQYRGNARFLMSDAMIAAVRKLKSGTDYIWTDSTAYAGDVRGGEPGRLFGYPVEVEPSMSGFGVNNIPVAFGDVSGYYIRDVNGLRLVRLNERFADENVVGFIAEHRTDGDLIDTNAVKTLKLAAV